MTIERRPGEQYLAVIQEGSLWILLVPLFCGSTCIASSMTRSQRLRPRIRIPQIEKVIPFVKDLSGHLRSQRDDSVDAIIVSRFGVAFLTEVDRDLKALCHGLPTFFNRAVNFAGKTRSGC